MFVLTANSIEYDGSISNVLSNRTNLVKRRSKGYTTISGYATVSRFYTNTTIKGSRLTNRTTGIRTQSPNRFACSNGSSTTTGRTTRYTFQVPRVMSCTEERTFIGGTHGKFVHIGFSKEDSFICTQFFNYVSVINGNKVLQHFRSTSSTQTKSGDIIFNCTGNTCQSGNFFTCGNFSIYFSSLCQSIFSI